MIEDTDLAYVAGFFDGEGSAFISFPKANKNGKRYKRITAKISQNNREVLNWVADLFGYGNVYARKLRDDGRQQHHEIVFAYLQARKFLTAIEPFLKIKRENVSALLDEAGRLSS